ncbi:U6 snRNA methylphosphate capping enzyme Amus [Cochliomyia hominivorax]
MKMGLNLEQPKMVMEEKKNEEGVIKRKLENDICIESHKRSKIDTEQIQNQGAVKQDVQQSKITKSQETKKLINNVNRNLSDTKTEELKEKIETITKVPNSPKKRLDLSKPLDKAKTNRDKFIYGNYSQYYGYRNKDKGYHDIRLDVFKEHQEIFKNKHILDIGCNSGFITMEVAKQFECKSIIGLDIDKTLINQAVKNLTKLKKSLPMDNELKRLQKFPFNITFVHGNYVLKDDVLLEIERPQFEVILCLSITKWIHLNFGDKGMKQAFKRMFLQLKPQGRLILEAQPSDNYGRRKKMTETIYKNFKEMKFLPQDFTQYLLSSEVGFVKMELMGVPDHCEKGFKRPIQIFFKN